MSELATDELRDAIRAAAHWYARLHSGAAGVGAADERERGEWARWLAASPQHRRAWQEVENTLAQIGRVPAGLAGPALQDAATARRRLLRNLAVVAALAPLSWGTYRASPWELTADQRTRIGERRRLTLPDGSLLALNTDSAADVAFTRQRREVQLRRGEILVATAPDPATTARPFLVTTPHGTVQALGTRFTVRVETDRTTVSVLEHAVRVSPTAAGERSAIVSAGQRIVFDTNAPQTPERADPAAGGWLDGSLVVVDMPLAQLLDELGRYRQGLLSCDPAIAGLKISGAFPVDDTERALLALGQSFPVRQQRLTRYWVRLVPA